MISDESKQKAWTLAAGLALAAAEINGRLEREEGSTDDQWLINQTQMCIGLSWQIMAALVLAPDSPVDESNGNLDR